MNMASSSNNTDKESDSGDWQTTEDDVEAEVLNLGRFMADNSGVLDIEVSFECAEGADEEMGEEVDTETVASCQKDHTKYIKCDEFQISHLPPQYQQQDIYDTLTSLSDLTVKLKLKKISPERPEFYPGTTTPYPFYNMHNSRLVRHGTGRVREVLKMPEDGSHGTCPCDKCRNSENPCLRWGEVYVSASTHVIFDDIEAKHAECFIKFRGHAKFRIIKGSLLRGAEARWDDSHLVCYTCDMDLVNGLYDTINRFEDISEEVSDKYMKSGDDPRLTIIVSHPHGGEKKLSIGQWTRRERQCEMDEDGQRRKTQYTVYMYDTCTCPGSSGAPIINFGKKTPFFNHHHCGSGKFGNFSGAAREEQNMSSDDLAEAFLKIMGNPRTEAELYEALAHLGDKLKP